MRELGKPLQEEVDRKNRDILAIRKVNSLQRLMSISEGEDSLIREIGHSHESNTPELWQGCKLKNR